MKAWLAWAFSRAASILSCSETTFDWVGDGMEEACVEERDEVGDCSVIDLEIFTQAFSI